MKNIALIGSPNVGKTSIFNKITFLRHKVGNFPGVTVEKKEANIVHRDNKYKLIDLPGTYNLFPNSLDEQQVFDYIFDQNGEDYPDLAVVISEPSSIKRSVVLYQQVRDLGVPAIFVINMIDELDKKFVKLSLEKLQHYLKTKVIATNARDGQGIEELKNSFDYKPSLWDESYQIPFNYDNVIEEIEKKIAINNRYKLWCLLSHNSVASVDDSSGFIEKIKKDNKIVYKRLQVQEILRRNTKVDLDLEGILEYEKKKPQTITEKIDYFLMHPVFGYLFFFVIIFSIFQGVYTFSSPIMDFIDNSFSNLINWLNIVLPEGPFYSLITNGFLKGISGILVFVPQITLLFLFISILEESGYMSRIVFLSDHFLRPFGLNGKSVVPLVSGAACAVPAIMAARTIEDTKERLLTMLITPFMTCVARLPIYIIIIELVIPDYKIWIFGLKGFALFIMYLLGIFGAIFSSFILNKFIKRKHETLFAIELPIYKMPDWRNVIISLYESVTRFLFGAGKIILAMAIIIWVSQNFSLNKDFYHIEEILQDNSPTLSEEDLANQVLEYKSEHSILGSVGHYIEPVFKPLGYDWKMTIGILSSFAAREVFVGTMAMIYGLGNDLDIEDKDQKNNLLTTMKKEKNININKPSYNLASGVSLLLFYAFAMQCMSTIATTKRETSSWKWTIFQFIFMSGTAYILAMIAYQTLKNYV